MQPQVRKRIYIPVEPHKAQVSKGLNKKESAKESMIQEVADFIIKNGGPDYEGRYHPEFKKIKLENLEAALQIAYQQGLDMRVQPYHFRYVIGINTTDRYRDEMLKLKASYMLKRHLSEDKNQSEVSLSDPENQSKILDLMTAKELRATEEVEIYKGKKVKVSFLQLFKDVYQAQPLDFAKAVFLVIGNAQLGKHLASYNLPNLPKRAANGEPYLSVYRDKIIAVAFGKARTNYRSLKDMISQVALKDFEQITYQRYGVTVPLNAMGAVRSVDTIFDALKVYLGFISETEPIARKFLDEQDGLRPYHLAKASNSSLSAVESSVSAQVDYGKELMLRAAAYQLVFNFSFDVNRMCNDCSIAALRKPFPDYVAGYSFTVSPIHVQRKRWFIEKDLREFLIENQDDIIEEAERYIKRMPTTQRKRLKRQKGQSA